MSCGGQYPGARSPPEGSIPTRQRRSRVALAKPGPLPPPSIVFGACEAGATGNRLRLARSLGFRGWQTAASLLQEPANRKCEDVARACASPMKLTLNLMIDSRINVQQSWASAAAAPTLLMSLRGVRSRVVEFRFV